MKTYAAIVQHFVNSVFVTSSQANILVNLAEDIDSMALNVRREAADMREFMDFVVESMDAHGAFSTLDSNISHRGSAQRLAEYSVKLSVMKEAYPGTFKAVTGRSFTSAVNAYDDAIEAVAVNAVATA